MNNPSALPPLSDAQIVEIAEQHGFCTIVEDAGYRANALWFDGQLFDFAQAIATAALSQPSESKP